MKTFAALILVATSGSACAADLGRGALLFQTCGACHSVLGDGLGPDLTGIFGRKAAERTGFNYSTAMRASGVVWNDTSLRTFLREPQALVKGTTMTFPGYTAPADVDDVIAYLKTLK